ncbi:MAG: prephenate dehydrogenase/arogenate dehydrogenase family protein [Anaerolineae bacterium]|nr:prephenate dehydrogenase/arogenate dehydrogenase family protein [Anaerolineae bacterium]
MAKEKTKNAQITIVGLGLIGSSIGKALCQGDRTFEVVGHDRDPKVTATARKIGAVDRTEWNLIQACEKADLIILALPVTAIRETLEAIAEDLKPGCVITDTASIKVPVLQWAEELLPPHAYFIGGDPIVSTSVEGGGVDAASADLLRNAVYCLCPTSTVSPDAVRVVSDLVSRVGAQPLFLDAAEHDGLTAGVDHLPSIVAAALLEVTALSTPWREMRKLAGGQYQSVTNLMSNDPEAYREAVLANKENVIHWIDALIANLQLWRQRVSEGQGDALEETFQRVFEARDQWLRQKATQQWEEREPIDTSGLGWRSLFGLGRRPRK